MKFKHQTDYDKLKVDCPPLDYQVQDMNSVFRWVFDEIGDERNFKSQYYKNPKRFQQKKDIDKCKSLGLSMFDDLMGAKNRFESLKKIMGEKVYKTLGTKVASGTLSTLDGVNSKIEKSRHFTHHPTQGMVYEKKFNIVENL